MGDGDIGLGTWFQHRVGDIGTCELGFRGHGGRWGHGGVWGHGDMGFRGHGSIRSPIHNTNTPLGFGICLLCRSTQLHHQNKLVSSSNIQNTALAKMNRHLQCGEHQVPSSNITKYRACHEKVTVMIDPVTYETSDGVRPLHPLLCEVIIKFYTLAKSLHALLHA